MAEKDLLKLLREKHPGEFTREQTDEMRALLGESKRLQNALARKLQFDQELAELVCGIDVPVDEIVEATEGRKAQVARPGMLLRARRKDEGQGACSGECFYGPREKEGAVQAQGAGARS